MRKRIPKILVTGGAGFIGSAFVRLISDNPFFLQGEKRGCLPPKTIVVDKLSYAGDLRRLAEVKGKIRFYKTDICDKARIRFIFQKEKPDIVAHFAAESHVDRSIRDAAAFIDTNVKGTQVLLDACREYGVSRFVFISSDEIYGEIRRGRFTEDSPLKPNSPYAVSKAAADLLVQAYIRTYKFPALIVRPCNNYGPWQYPEKLIPLAILRALKGEKVPIYGNGRNVRQWLYVDDCAQGIAAVMKKGRLGQAYNLGGGSESRNIDTVKLLLKVLGTGADKFKFVKDRPGHDIRYCLDSGKAAAEFGWKPPLKLAEGLRLTAWWALGNREWMESKLAEVNRLYHR